MTIVDLAKARSYADLLRSVPAADQIAAGWLEELADEVESQERTITELRVMVADVEADAAKTQDERDAALAALHEVYAAVSKLIREADL